MSGVLMSGGGLRAFGANPPYELSDGCAAAIDERRRDQNPRC